MCKENPLLLTLNPPEMNRESLKLLLLQAKELVPDLDESEFCDAVDLFFKQHHMMPKLQKISINDKIKNRVFVKVGDMKNVIYEPPKGSRKSPKNEKYIHYTNDSLVTDCTGKIKMLIGDMRMEDDGWLHK